MDPVFGSPYYVRMPLTPNKQRSVSQQFQYDASLGYKADEMSLKYAYGTPGRGVQGESVNSQNNASKQILKKSWKPV